VNREVHWLMLSLRGVRLGSQMTYAAPRMVSKFDSSKNRIDTRTQTEGPSSYWYRIYSTSCQADTKCTSTCKATDPTSKCTSIESQEPQVLLVVVLSSSQEMV
jgi:hypothetical protein